ADLQTDGRGRRDRVWSAPSGSSMLISVLLRPELEPADLFLITMIAGLSLRSAVRQTYELGVDIKWPNDLELDGKKLSGVLAQTQLDPYGRRVVIVGAGLNVQWSADDLEQLGRPATSIATCLGRSVGDIDPLIRNYLGDLWAWYCCCATEEGRRSALQEYRESCSTLGRRVEVHYLSELRRGLAQDVNERGELIVNIDGEAVPVNAADIVHLRPETSD
ncbi:MAG: biotin--[acetyl-CoA-carboxylase] ligase, partial [Acidimicrobiales bacterium]